MRNAIQTSSYSDSTPIHVVLPYYQPAICASYVGLSCVRLVSNAIIITQVRFTLYNTTTVLTTSAVSCTRPSDDHHFRPVSRLEKGVCQKIRHEIEQARIRLPDVPQNNVVTDRVSGIALEAEFPYRRVPVLNANDESSFRYLWAKRLPVHIKKVDVKGIWTPEHLSQTHGNDDVKVIDSRYCTLQNKKLSNFLTELTALGEGEPDHVVKLRVGSSHLCLDCVNH